VNSGELVHNKTPSGYRNALVPDIQGTEGGNPYRLRTGRMTVCPQSTTLTTITRIF
jgi:hypothetical protein